MEWLFYHRERFRTDRTDGGTQPGSKSYYRFIVVASHKVGTVVTGHIGAIEESWSVSESCPHLIILGELHGQTINS